MSTKFSELRTVQVVGTGSSSGVPDALRLNLRLRAIDAGVSKALDKAMKALDATTSAIKKFGVADKDLRSSGASISDYWDQKKGEQSGYEASHSLTIMLREPAKGSDLIAECVKVAGDALRVDQMALVLEDDAALISKARELAWADAVDAATRLAQLAGKSLGEALRIVEGSGPDLVPVARQDTMFMAGAAKGRGSIELGENSVEVTVSVLFELT